MSSKRCLSFLPFAACALVLGLSGCAAVPLAQLAVSQMAPANQGCTGCSGGMTSGSFGDISKTVAGTLRKLAGPAAENQTVANNAPMK